MQIHKDTTAAEIWADTDGKVDVVVCGVGTGGTFTGVASALKEKKEGLKAYAVEPESSAVLSGGQPGSHKIQGIGAGFIPEILDQELIDGIAKVSDEQAITVAREAARLEGLPAGLASGAILAAAIDIAKIPEHKDKQIVAVISSFAERYLNTDLFEGMGH